MPNATEATAPRMGVRVLIVDDNQDTADTLAVLVQRWGHEARAAYHGVTALKVAAELRPDVIFLDLAMPGMDGYQLAEQLRRLPETQSAVLVAITAHLALADQQRFTQAGFNHHLIKPVEPDVVKMLLTLWIRTR